MPRSTPSGLLLLALAAMALGTGCTSSVPGTASAGAVSAAADAGDPEAWVDQFCGSLVPFVRTTGEPPNPRDADSAEDLVQNISDYLGEAEEAAGSAISGMTAAGPSPVVGGDDIVTRWSNKLSTMQDSFRDARTRIDGVDLNDRQAVLAEVPAAITPVKQLSNPTDDLQGNPELDQASQDAANCKQIDREYEG